MRIMCNSFHGSYQVIHPRKRFQDRKSNIIQISLNRVKNLSTYLISIVFFIEQKYVPRYL